MSGTGSSSSSSSSRSRSRTNSAPGEQQQQQGQGEEPPLKRQRLCWQTPSIEIQWRLVPAPQQKKSFLFQVGDKVFFRPKSACSGQHGTIVPTKETIQETAKETLTTTDRTSLVSEVVAESTPAVKTESWPTTSSSSTDDRVFVQFSTEESAALLSKQDSPPLSSPVINKKKKGEGRANECIHHDKDKKKNTNSTQQFLRSVSTKRLLPIFRQDDSPSCSFTNNMPTGSTQRVIKILVMGETQYYRHMAASQLKNKDHVIEIGCSTGEASMLMLRHHSLQSWIGLDTSKQMIRECTIKIQKQQQQQQKSSSSSFWWQTIHMDALADPRGVRDYIFKTYHRQQQKQPSETDSKTTTDNGCVGPTAVYMDIGGNREEENVIKMITWVLESFTSSIELLVIKSRELLSDITTNSIAKGHATTPVAAAPDATATTKTDTSLPPSISSTNKITATDDSPSAFTTTGGRVSSLPSLKITRLPEVDQINGIVYNGNEWFEYKIEEIMKQNSYTNTKDDKGTFISSTSIHPLQAPLVYSPMDATVPICRYHNYHKQGCQKGTRCPYDHEHCHRCLIKGHCARQCKQKM